MNVKRSNSTYRSTPCGNARAETRAARGGRASTGRGGATRGRRARAGGRGARAALAHVVADVVPLAVRVVDVVLGLVERAVHACGRANERICAGLVGGELSIDGGSAIVH